LHIHELLNNFIVLEAYMSTKSKVLIFASTRKGGFILSSDAPRKKWEKSDLLFKGWNVMHMQLDPRDLRLHAAVVHDAYGPTTHYSDDFGKSWTQASKVPAFARPSRSGRPIGTVQEASESEYQLLLAHDLDFLSKEIFDNLQSEVEEVKRMLAGLLKTIRADR
jgi:hypothetical protein